MKKFLLFALLLVSVTAVTRAHQTDTYTIIYDDGEIISTSNPNGWDPNGTIPPQPEAEYYINMQNASQVYYRLLKVSDSPLEYQSYVPIIIGNFKIYAKEYWTDRHQSGYNGNDFIFGSKSDPTHFNEGELKDLGHPGGDLQINGGGVWYGCQLSFFPNGKDNGGTPQLIVSGGSHDEPTMRIESKGTCTGSNSGTIIYQIYPAGIVKPEEQTYTVTLTYTNKDGNTRTITKSVTGTSGSFGIDSSDEMIDDLKADATTPYTITAEVKNAPYYNNPANPDVIAGYKDITATGTGSIKTIGDIYLIGNIYDNQWIPANAVKSSGRLTDYNPGYPGASMIFVWENVVLTGDARFRFTNGQYADLATLESSGIQYYPSVPTQTCANLFATTAYTDWYDATSGSGATDNAWAPASTTEGKYNIFYDAANNKVAIGWGVTTGVDELIDNTKAEYVDVYTVTGLQVRTGVDRSAATDNLPAGIYIIGGKKVAIR